MTMATGSAKPRGGGTGNAPMHDRHAFTRMTGMTSCKKPSRAVPQKPFWPALGMSASKRRPSSGLDLPKRGAQRREFMAKTTKSSVSQPSSSGSTEQLLRVRIKALEIPPVKDGLVVGRDAAIGGEAMTRTLRLMTTEKFERFALKDDVIQDVIVRSAVVRKLGRERVLKFVIDRIKPLMADTELLMLDIDVELVIEDIL